MYEMLKGKPLFNFSDGKININEYKKEIILPNNFSEESKDLIIKLLNKDPKKRLGSGKNGFNNLKNHEYFKNINWDDLENKKIKAPFVPNLDNSMDLKYFDKIFTEEVNITKENNDDSLNNSTKTTDNYVNFSYFDPSSSSFQDQVNQNLTRKSSKETQ